MAFEYQFPGPMRQPMSQDEKDGYEAGKSLGARLFHAGVPENRLWASLQSADRPTGKTDDYKRGFSSGLKAGWRTAQQEKGQEPVLRGNIAAGPPEPLQQPYAWHRGTTLLPSQARGRQKKRVSSCAPATSGYASPRNVSPPAAASPSSATASPVVPARPPPRAPKLDTQNVSGNKSRESSTHSVYRVRRTILSPTSPPAPPHISPVSAQASLRQSIDDC